MSIDNEMISLYCIFVIHCHKYLVSSLQPALVCFNLRTRSGVDSAGGMAISSTSEADCDDIDESLKFRSTIERRASG